jgi:hypothetical protein
MATRAHGASGSMAAGLALVYQSLLGQAAALSYVDTYVVLAAAAAAMFFLSFLLKSNNPSAPEQGSVH